MVLTGSLDGQTHVPDWMTRVIAEFRLPDLGEGLTESEILVWHVKAGDRVTLNQVIADVETAKAVVELPSPYAGTVHHIVHDPGTIVDVGEVIIAFDVAAAATKDAPSDGQQPGQPTESDDQPKRIPTLVGYGAEPESSRRPQRRSRNISAPSQAPASLVQESTVPSLGAEPKAPASKDSQAERPRSTPPVRKLARDLGVDLEAVDGTGERGLITRADVLAHQTTATATLNAGTSVREQTVGVQGEREVRTPIKGVRKHTANAMVQSAFTAPHVTEFLTIDVTAGMEFLDRLKQKREFSSVKLTPLTLAAKAVCLAIKRLPSLNSRWDESAGEIVTYNYVNLGIAAATPRGLLVPQVKEAQSLPLVELGQAINQLAQTARDGKTAPSELSGGTFSITNIGVFGIDAGTPILNPGEAGILALGAVRRTPWEFEGRIELRQVMTLSLSFDHRLVDGEQGSRFLADVGALMSDPAMSMALG